MVYIFNLLVTPGQLCLFFLRESARFHPRKSVLRTATIFSSFSWVFSFFSLLSLSIPYLDCLGYHLLLFMGIIPIYTLINSMWFLLFTPVFQQPLLFASFFLFLSFSLSIPYSDCLGYHLLLFVGIIPIYTQIRSMWFLLFTLVF